MRCDEFEALVLADAESRHSAEHESNCARCRAGAAHMREMRAAITDSDVWEAPSVDLRTRVVAAVANEAHLRQAPPDRRIPWIGAVAAVAVILVGFMSFVALRNPPDWEVAIEGTGLAPDASGVVAGWNDESGTRMVLDVSGLDPAPPGYVYELWLSADYRHISAGTFIQPGDDLELWAGVSRRDYPRVWVTLERLDDNESFSGETVLDTGA